MNPTDRSRSTQQCRHRREGPGQLFWGFRAKKKIYPRRRPRLQTTLSSVPDPSQGSGHLPSLSGYHLGLDGPSRAFPGSQAASGAPRGTSPSPSDQPGFSFQLNPRVANASEVHLVAGGRGRAQEAVGRRAAVHVGLQGLQELLRLLFGRELQLWRGQRETCEDREQGGDGVGDAARSQDKVSTCVLFLVKSPWERARLRFAWDERAQRAPHRTPRHRPELPVIPPGGRAQGRGMKAEPDGDSWTPLSEGAISAARRAALLTSVSPGVNNPAGQFSAR